ncbi:hypothetical protein GCM10022419_123980 [Nonomuraea rosea]|uniref:Uncharacterized protein n=1 Tax=Nonomuraea rosea TaxID=638574 RepID=A0ABP6ZUF3_9ACTN
MGAAPEASWAFSDWLAGLTRLRAARIADPGVAGADDLFAALFEFPVRVGAQLGGAEPGTMETLNRKVYYWTYQEARRASLEAALQLFGCQALHPRRLGRRQRSPSSRRARLRLTQREPWPAGRAQRARPVRFVP